MEEPKGPWMQYPKDPWNEITTNLWQGGMFFGPQMKPAILGEEFGQEFDVVINMAGNGGKMRVTDPRIEVHSFYIDDAPLGPAELDLVWEARDLAKDSVLLNKRTLVRCQMGLNRSGLVVALTLLALPPFKGACCAGHAIGMIRRKRSPDALCNEWFVNYIKSQRESIDLLLEEADND